MKPAALLYISSIDYLREVAREHGYALAVHGSLARDLDLLACPWIEHARPAEELAESLRKKLELCTGEKWYAHQNDPGAKPHGRLAWNFVPGCGGGMFVDLSIMPLAVTCAATAIKQEMSMAKFRKKPVVIEAVQWFEPGHENHNASLLVHRKGNSVNPPDYRQVGDFYLAVKGGPPLGGHDVYMIRTLEGYMRVSSGEWIITGVKGEKYACKPDIFAATYEPVLDDQVDP
jgi:hypothetical protein